LGDGSEFVVHLPMMATPAVPPPGTDLETVEPTGPSLRVLVVDDNVDAARTLGMLLKESEHDVRMAYDGQTALKAALDFRPNVALLDLGLPGLDGFEVAKRLRHEGVLNGIVLIAMTGYGHESDRQRSLDAGFDHHLVKPAAFGKLRQILATVSAKAT
jgi:DNA-binding response OmpR family regulator